MAFFTRMLQKVNLRRQQVIRLAAGIVLVLLAALFTVFIRDALSMQNPENALPVMDVYYNGRQAGDRLPAANIRRDRYAWKFLFGRPAVGGGLDLEVWREIEPGLVNPNSDLDLAFSFEPKSVRIFVAAGESAFVETDTDLYAPAARGVYTYRVQASWGGGRDVTYYFRVSIPW